MIKMDAFWPEFEKRGYITIGHFTDSSKFSDDELKDMGMGKIKIQFFRRVLEKSAAQNYLLVNQGPMNDEEEIAMPVPPDETPAEASASASQINTTAVLNTSSGYQSQEVDSIETMPSVDALSNDLHVFLVTNSFDKFETALVAQGLTNLGALNDEVLATNEALAACGLKHLEIRKLRIFVSRHKLVRPAAFFVPTTNGSDGASAIVEGFDASAGVEAEDVSNLAMAVGDLVTWKGSDDDLPSGTVGRVETLYPEDGDAECVFETAAGPQTFTFKLTRLDRVEPSEENVAQLVVVDDGTIKVKYAEALKSNGQDELKKATFKALTRALLQDYQGVAEADLPLDKDLDAAFAAADQNKRGQVSEREFLALFQVIAQGGAKNLHKASVFSPKTKTAAFKKTYLAAAAANTFRAQQVAAAREAARELEAARKLVRWRRRIVALEAARELEALREFLAACKLEPVLEVLAAHGVASMASLHDPRLTSDAALEACMSKLDVRRLRVFLAKRGGVATTSPAANARASGDYGALVTPLALSSVTPKQGSDAGLLRAVPQEAEL